MCGRFVQTSSAQRLAATFSATDVTDAPLGGRYNVAPSTPIPAIIAAPERRLGTLTWGFVPSWSKDPNAAPKPINARAEGASSSRLFASALRHRRCIVPIDAWYEWTQEGTVRQPWLMQPAQRRPLAIAALWSSWRPKDDVTGQSSINTVALLTTEAHGDAATVHHRMPLSVPEGLIDRWLDRGQPADASLLAEMAEEVFDIDVTRVSRDVNDVRNDHAGLLAPAR